MVRNTLKKCLHFTSIEVTGYRMDANGSRGLNVVALDARDHTPLLAKAYDTFGNGDASADLIKDLRGVRRGSVIIAAVKDEGSKKLSSELKALFSKWGSTEINSLGFREGWAFIGVKGQKIGVEKRGGIQEMGIILGYAKRTTRTRTKEEVAAGSSIEIFSAGAEAGEHNSYAEIKINGEEVVGRHSSKRGINLIALNGPDHKIILNDSYNTYTQNKDESARLVKDFNSLPAGAVVIAAVKDDASHNLHQSVKQVFVSMGSSAVKNLGFKHGWGFLGIKGMKKSGEDTGVSVEFGTVLSFTKVVKKKRTVEKVEGGSKIQALSQGFVDGNSARIVVNDQDILEKAGRGFNVIILAGQNHEVLSSKTYDTFASKAESEKMVNDAANAPVGSVIIAAIKDEGSRMLTQEAKDIFTAMGAKEINNLGYRDGYVFIGVRGSKSHVEKRAKSTNTGIILGYSRVTKRVKKTKTITQTKSYKKTIRRVYKKVVTSTRNGVTSKRTITRVQKRTITCKRSRKI